MHIPSRHPSNRPFMAVPRTQFYHPATLIDAALKGIERCIRRAEGVALVVGPPGTGKSLLLAKVAEQVRDDFDVALLSGASICTRRALWQAVMAAIGEPFRGIDEGDLRLALVERIRGLAASGAGLVILVDEANTLPTRLIEELRLLTNVPTPLPAVHIVLAGSLRLEEMLAGSRMESLAQRIAVRGYLEPLDHAETMAYLRGQTRAAGLAWERLFATGCDDAVFKATDGVPRLINQLCDQSLVLVAESRRLVTPADIAAAWREIQRLPAPSGLDTLGSVAPLTADLPPDDDFVAPHSFEFGGDGMEMIEFGSGDDPVATAEPAPARGDGQQSQVGDPWSGPDVELVFDHTNDPFESLFHAAAGGVVERFNVDGPETFHNRLHVKSREGQALGRLLASLSAPHPAASTTPASVVQAATLPAPVMSPMPVAPSPHPEPRRAAAVEEPRLDVATTDDADMVVIEDDVDDSALSQTAVLAVRPGDYRSLFTRLRRGDRS